MALAGFDAKYYLLTYPDVAAASAIQGGLSPEQHFLQHGVFEGRNPNASFNTVYYTTNNPDVAEAVRAGYVANVYLHYVANGAKEGRASSAALAQFDSKAYFDANKDLAADGWTAENAVGHYVLFGAAEGRSPVSSGAIQVTGTYAGTEADNQVNPIGNQATTVRIEGGQQGAVGDTLVITAGSGTAFQTINLSLAADQNVTRELGGAGNKLGPTVQGFENVDGSQAAHALTLTALDRTSVANAGGVASAITGSVLIGGAYQDNLAGGTGDDSLVGNAGDDSINGGAGNDTLLGGVGNDTLIGGAGNDSIDGGVGNDSIDGGTGNDTIISGGGNDTIDGGAGNDRISVGAGTSSVNGGAGNDTIELTGDQGTTTLASTLLGGAGDDIITLNGTGITAANRVSVSGGSGNDTITAGLGFETINGGSGNDTIIVTQANIGTTDVFNGNDGQDILQLNLPTDGSVFNFAPGANQFSGFEAIALTDSSGTSVSKTYLIRLTNDFIANNVNGGNFLIDARGLVGGSNVVIDFSALTAVSAAAFTNTAGVGNFRILTSGSTTIRDQNNNTINAAYAVNTTNPALNAVTGFTVYNAVDGIVAGSDAAYTTDRLVNTGTGQATYTAQGGTVESGTPLSAEFQIAAGNTLTNAYNGSEVTNTNPTGTNFLTAASNSIIAGSFVSGQFVATANALNTVTILDTSTTDTDSLTAILTTNNTPTSITNIETFNLTSYGTGALNFNVVSNLKTLNITGQSFIGTNLTAGTGTTINLNNLAAGGTVALSSAAAGVATLTANNVSTTLTLGTYNGATIAATGTNTLNGLANIGTYTVTGSGTLALSNANTADSVVNASAYTGALTFTQSSAGNATITGGIGDDTFAFGANLTSLDVIVGGAGADRLTVSAANAATDLDNVSGVETITLAAGVNYVYAVSAASAQANDTTVVTLNAGALAAANTLNFNGSAAGHSYVITGGAGGDAIVGSTSADTITGGNGADVITGGRGNDTINLSESTPSVDTVVYNALAAGVSSEGGDTITSFSTSGTLDVLRFTALAANYNLGNDDVTIDSPAVGAAAVGIAASELVINTTKLASLAAVQANLTTQVGAVTAGQGVLLVAGDATNTYVFHDADGSTAGGVTLVATLVGVDVSTVTAANFAFVV